MNIHLKHRLLRHLTGRNHNGFTLIELLVVVIIVGILAAVAIPGFLNQVGKARETEAKTSLSAFMRAQESYHLEKQAFYQGNNWRPVLGVFFEEEFYQYTNTTDEENRADAAADALNPANNNTRDYAIGVTNTNGQLSAILCVASDVDNASGTNSAVANGSQCTMGESIR